MKPLFYYHTHTEYVPMFPPPPKKTSTQKVKKVSRVKTPLSLRDLRNTKIGY